MNNKVMHRAETYRKTRKKQKWLYRALSVAAAGVVFCTTYALILPAITMEEESAHIHGADCYAYSEVVDVFACPYGDHAHEEICYDSNGETLCGWDGCVLHVHDETCPDDCAEADFMYHVHDELCWQEDTLVCTLPEILPEEHRHTDECYAAGEPVCGLEEGGHTHDESCMGEISRELTCTTEEYEGHTHGNACYITEITSEPLCMLDHAHEDTCFIAGYILDCDIPESEGHTHGDECYTVEMGVVCEIPEEGHTHTEECYDRERVCGVESEAEMHQHTEDCFAQITVTYSEPVLICELEEADKWELAVPTELSGVYAQDLLTVAESQIGYEQDEEDVLVDATTGAVSYASRYGLWYGQPYEEWNTLFVMYCLEKAGIGEDVMPRNADAQVWMDALMAADQYRAEEYVPQAGDLVFRQMEEGVRVGVLSADGMYSIEGNLNGTVAEAELYDVLGYGVIDAAEVEETSVTTTIEGMDGEVVLTGRIPAGVTVDAVNISVFEVAGETLFASEADQSTEQVIFRIDITPYDNEGNPWQPAEGETVTIKLNAAALGIEDGTYLTIHHEHDGEVRSLGVYSVQDNVLSFETDGFSTFSGTLNNTNIDIVTDDEITGNITVSGTSSITLTGRIVQNGTITIPQGVILSVYGSGEIIRGDNFYGTLFNVKGGTLNFIPTVGKTITIDGNVSWSSSEVSNSTRETLTINNSNHKNIKSPAIYVDSTTYNGTVNIQNVIFKNLYSESDCASVIHATGKSADLIYSTIHMTDVVVQDCSTMSGQSIVLLNDSLANIKNCTFNNNFAGGTYSGIIKAGGPTWFSQLNMEECVATGNYSSGWGGVILWAANTDINQNIVAKADIKSCKFDDNKARYLGGAISNEALMYVENTVISNNVAMAGGGIATFPFTLTTTEEEATGKNACGLNLLGGNTIKNNTAFASEDFTPFSKQDVDVNGTGYDNSDRTLADDVVIETPITYPGGGGGIWYYMNKPNWSCSLELGAGNIISGNESNTLGGGVYMHHEAGTGTNLNITGADIQENEAVYGGGVALTNANCTISGDEENQIFGTISKNTANNGGGIYVVSGSMSVKGGYITDNKATGTPSNSDTTYYNAADAGVGGGIYLKKGTFSLGEGSAQNTKLAVGIYNNLADFAADDVYASGDDTVLSVPAVNYMKTTFDVGAAWYEDYHDPDAYYSVWNSTGKNKGRYKSLGYLSSEAYGMDVGNMNAQNAFINATIGIANTLNLDIFKVNAAGDVLTDAVFSLEYQFSDTWIPVSDKDNIVIDKIKVGEGDGKIHVEQMTTTQAIYRLIENEAPDGYNIMTSPVYFKFSTGGVYLCDAEGKPIEYMPDVSTAMDQGTLSITVTNHAGTELPQTGGPGITKLYMFSALLIAGAAGGLIYKTRRRQRG